MIEFERQPFSRRDRSAYDLVEEALPRPALPGDVVAKPTPDELIDTLAAELVRHAENCVRQFGDFHLALSGGAVFDMLYRRLMYDPNYRWLPWRRTHLWFVAERCVPFDDERSFCRMLSEIIGDHADIPPEQFHPIFAQSMTADTDYEDQVRDALAWRERGQDRLDYVLLTMDERGRTAGLMPDSSALRETERLVRRTAYGEPTVDDFVTMTAQCINAARFIAVLITGAEMAPVVRRLAEGHETLDEMPIKSIAPLNGELRWYLDGPACGVDVDIPEL
jgi:6-phosphogluconolactonase/glucosamine-6-phosphate isomerase/deaminase